MNNFNKLAATALICLSFTNMSYADDLSKAEARALIEPFYALLNGENTADQVRQNFTSDWKSYNNETSYKGLEKTIGTFEVFSTKLIPDLKWDIKNVSVTSDNEIVIRGEATGTPAGETFFGVPIDGKSFRIMSMDVHTVVDGKVVKTYHVEDWSSAIQQVAAK